MAVDVDGLQPCANCGATIDAFHHSYCAYCGEKLPSLYDEAYEAAGAKPPTSSSGTSPEARRRTLAAFRDPGPQQPEPFEGPSVIPRLTAAERAMRRAEADWDDAHDELVHAQIEFPDHEGRDPAALTPGARTRYLRVIAAVRTEAAARQAYEQAQARLDPLVDEYNSLLNQAHDAFEGPRKRPDSWVGPWPPGSEGTDREQFSWPH